MSSSGPAARAFLVVRVVHDATGAPVPTMCLRATYGADGATGASEDADLVEQVAAKHFCFPEFIKGSLTSVTPTERMKAEQYTFSLTEGDGSRVTGVCRRFLPPGEGLRYPVVACVLTANHDWVALFFDVLEMVEPHLVAVPPLAPADAPTDATVDLPPDALAAVFLRAVCARPAAAPGSQMVIPLPWHPPGTGFPGEATLRVPGSNPGGGSDVRFAPIMFHGGGVHAALALFAALTHERRVVLSGSDLGVLSSAVRAAAATLRPLAWQHIFLPLMPAGFVDYLTAPMPFLVGLPAALVPVMKRLPCEEVFHLDLDTGEYTYFPGDLESLPTRPARALQHVLETNLRGVRHDDAAIGAAFRRFFAAVIGSYKRHVISEGERECPADAIAAGGLWLDQEGFVTAAASRRTRLLLEAMRGTQMYEVFVRERLAAMSGGKVKSGSTDTGGWAGNVDVDFDAELADDVALGDLVRAGTASAAAGTARAAAAAAAAASYGYKKSAAYYSSFVSSGGSAGSAAASKAYAAYNAYFNGARSNPGSGGSAQRGQSAQSGRVAPSEATTPSRLPRGSSGGSIGSASGASTPSERTRDLPEDSPAEEVFERATTLADQIAAVQARRAAAIQAARSTGNLGLDWGLEVPDDTVPRGDAGRVGESGGGKEAVASGRAFEGASASPSGAGGGFIDPFTSSPRTDSGWVDLSGGDANETTWSDPAGVMSPSPAAPPPASLVPPLTQRQPPLTQQQPVDPGDALAAALGMLDVAGAPQTSSPSTPVAAPFGDLLS